MVTASFNLKALRRERLALALASKPGFFDVPHPGYFMESMVKIGPETQPVVLNLIAEGVIYGHIQNPDG